MSWWWLALIVTILWLSLFRRRKDGDEGMPYTSTPYVPNEKS